MFQRWPVFHRVLVNLTDGTAFDALLLEVRGPLLTLTDCTIYAPGTDPQQIDGNVYVERSRVLYLQKPRGD